MRLLLRGPRGYRRSAALELLGGLGLCPKMEEGTANRFGELSLLITDRSKIHLRIDLWGEGPIQTQQEVSAHLSWNEGSLPIFTPYLKDVPYTSVLKGVKLTDETSVMPALYRVGRSHYLIPVDLFGQAGALLYLLGHRSWHKDDHLRYADRYHLPVILGLSEETPVNAVARFILDLLSALCKKHNLLLPRLLPWPNSAPFAGALTFDLDGFRPQARIPSLAEPFYNLLKGRFKRLPASLGTAAASLGSGNAPRFNLPTILSRMERIAARATFFISASHAGRRHLLDADYHLDEPITRRCISAIKNGPGEIALHAGYKALFTDKELQAQKECLENVAGEVVVGSRSHYLRLQYPKGFNRLAGVGISYDSTLAFSTIAGFRAGYCLPFRPLPGEENVNILEMPPMAMDTILFQVMKLDHNQAKALLKRLIQRVAGYNGLAVYILHDYYFSPGEFRHMQDTFNDVINMLGRPGAWMATLKEIDLWWRKRGGVIAEADRKDRRWEFHISSKDKIEGLTLTILGKVRGRLEGKFSGGSVSKPVAEGEPITLPPLTAGETGLLKLEAKR